MDVADPLRFGQEEDNGQEELLLQDEAPLQAAGGVAPAAHAAAAGSAADPLSLASSSSTRAVAVPGAELEGYLDAYALNQQHEQHQNQHQQQGAAPPVMAASSGAVPCHRQQPSLTLDSLDIGADKGSLLLPDGAKAGAVASTRPPPDLQISVTDPVRRVGDSKIPGFTSTHTEYLVTSSHGGQGGQRRRVEVRRRFKDFVALADLLAITHRGYFVFPRPDKNTLDQQLGKSDFVELRRMELERYLRKLAAHPVVVQAEELLVFLEAEGSLAASFAWQQLQPLRGSLLEGIGRLPRQLIGSDSSVPSTVEAQQNARNTSDLLRRFRELGERMRQEYKAPPVLAHAEARLRERKVGVEEYAEKLAAASRRAERMVKEFEETGSVMGDLGLSLVKMAKYEDEEGNKCGQYSELGMGARSVAADARRVGLAAVRHSRLARAANSQAMEALEPLHDELAMSPAVAAALREREAALLTAQSIEEDLEKRRRAVGQLEESGARRVGGDATNPRKLAVLQNDVAALDAALAAAQQEYERVKQRNLQDLERTQQERSAEFAWLAHGFAEVEGLYSQHCLENWQGVAKDFGASGQLQAQQQSRQ